MVSDDNKTQEQLIAALDAARTRIADLEQTLNLSRPSLVESPFVEFFHAAEDPASFLDRNLVYQAVNSAYSRYFGRPVEDIIGLRVVDLLGEEVFQSRIRSHLERCLAGEHVSYEAWVDFPLKGRSYMHVSYYPSRNNQGEIVGVLHISRDQTEHKLKDLEVQQERDKFSGILASLNTGLSVINPDLTVDWVNDQIHRMFPEGSPLGVVCHEFYEGQQAPCKDCPTIKVFETGEAYHLERYNAKDGRWYFILAQPILDASGKVTKVLEGITDITERKRSEKALREKERFISSILETVPVPLFYKDRDGRYQGFNKSFENFFGKSKEELVGKSVFDINPPDLAKVYHAKDAELFDNPGTQIYSSQVKNVHGRLHDVIFHKATLTDDQDSVTGLIGAVLDVTEQKQAEKKLKEKTSLLEAILDNTPDIMSVKRPDLSVVRYNKAGYSFLNKSPEQIKGAKCFELIGRNVPCQPCATQAAFKTKKPVVLEKYLPELDMYLNCRTNPIFSDDGEVEFTVELIRDITPRKKVEEEIRKFKTVSDQAVHGIAISDMHGNLQYINHYFARLHGYSPEELIGHSLSILHNEDQREKASEIIDVLIKEGRFSNKEVWHANKDGNVFPMLMSAVVIKDEDGTAQFLAATAIDITQRKRAEEALRESEARYRAYVDNAPLGVFIANNAGQYLEVNAEACRITGYAASELLGKSLIDLIDHEQLEDAHKHFEQVLTEGRAYGEVAYRTKDGDKRWWNVVATKLSEDRLLGFAEDITTRKQAEEELKRIEWMLSSKPISNIEASEETHAQGYGDLTELNRDGLILKSIGKEHLSIIAKDYLELLGTSSAIYEANGDYAFRIFASGWCQIMDRASRNLCETSDNVDALNSGRWLCHESCWTDCSKEAIAKCAPVDIECIGGIRLFATPIFAGGKVVGAINFGYGDPPRDSERLKMLVDAYHLNYDDLLREATAYDSRPPYIIEMAKRRLMSTAKLIGSMIEAKRAEEALKESEERFKALHNASFGGIAIHDKGIILDCNQGLSEISGYSQEELVGMNGLLLIAERSRSEVMRNILEGYEKPYDAFGVRKSGEEYPVRLEARNIPYRGQMARVVEFRDVTEARRTEEEQASLKARLQALWHVSRMVEANYKELCDLVLEEIKNLTGSQYSFFGFLNETKSVMSIHSWSKEAMADCAVEVEHIHFPIDKAGVWARSIVEKRPVIINDYEQTAERKKGVPAGHVPIQNLLTIPFLKHGKTAAIAAIANKPSGYTDEDIFQINAFVTNVMLLLDQRRIKQELKTSEERLALALDTVNEGVWDWRVDTGSVFFNSIWYSMLGYDPGEMPQEFETWRMLVHPNDLAHAEEVIARSLENAKPFDMEFRMKDKMRGWRWINAKGRVVEQDEKRRAVRMLGTHMDITDRKRSEEALLQAKQEFEGIFENSQVGIMLLKGDRVVSRVNKRLADLLGYKSPEEMKKISVRQLHLDEQHFLEFGERYYKPLGQGEQTQVEYQLRKKDGTPLWAILSGKALDPTDLGKGVIWVMDDLTRRKALEAQLTRAKESAESASQAKSEFLANMSHEIRTPLNGIIGMLQLMQDTSLDEEQGQFLTLAMESSKRLTRLLSDILDLSRVEAGKLQMQVENFALHEIVKQIAALHEPVSLQAGVRFQVSQHPGLPSSILGDSLRLQQVLTNLIGNAFKFTTAGSVTLEVSSLPSRRTGEAHLLFVVADTGCGMDENILETLFEPFVQASQGYTRRYQGAGLGLSIVKRIVELMGGTISVESELGVGTTFYVAIPFKLIPSDVVGEEKSTSNGTALAQGEFRILIAEDDMVSSMAVARLLEKKGHRIHVVRDGEEALDALRKRNFDLVLMDVQMPSVDGVEATKRIRIGEAGEAKADIPIIAMTAYTMVGDREMFLAAGMNDYIAKPVEWEFLQAVIDKCARVKFKNSISSIHKTTHNELD